MLSEQSEITGGCRYKVANFLLLPVEEIKMALCCVRIFL